MKRTNAVVLAIASACSFLTGCASDTFHRANESARSSTLAYGIVTEVKSADTSGNRSICEKGPDAKYKPICANLKGFDETHLVFLHSSRFLEGNFFVPTDWLASKNAIIQVNPMDSYIATRVAAHEPHKGCEWKGRTPEQLNSGTAAVTGFAMGMLIVPALVVAADDSILQGGVECEGWTYTSLLNKS